MLRHVLTGDNISASPNHCGTSTEQVSYSIDKHETLTGTSASQPSVNVHELLHFIID